jgi:hypothetical protein
VVNLEKMFVGFVVMYVATPTTINGAVSPKALDTAKIVPVKIPEIEFGNT